LDKNYNYPIKNVQVIQKKPSALKREHPTLQNMKFLIYFYFCGSFLPSWIRIQIRIHNPGKTFVYMYSFLSLSTSSLLSVPLSPHDYCIYLPKKLVNGLVCRPACLTDTSTCQMPFHLISLIHFPSASDPFLSILD
jgi:hypothetical protein